MTARKAEGTPDWCREYDRKNELLKERGFEEVSLLEFYRDLFPEGSLQKKGEWNSGKGTMLVTVLNTGYKRAPRFFVTDDLEKLKDLKSTEYWLIDPISFFGVNSKKNRAHELFAMVIDIDYVQLWGLKNLLKQFRSGVQLAPTYLVNSGKGLHLYYFFRDPLPLLPDYEKIYSELNKALSLRLWNDSVTEKKEVDLYGVVHGFRSVGSITRVGSDRPVRAFRISGKRYTPQDLKDSIPDCEIDLEPKKKIPLELAKKMYPEWYQRKILHEDPDPREPEKRKNNSDRRRYDAWKRRMWTEIRVGARYYSIMGLCAFGLKDGVPDQEIRKDAKEILSYYDSLTDDENNHFKMSDIDDALNYCLKRNRSQTKRSSWKWISEKTKVTAKPKRRNGRKRADHLAIARATKAELKKRDALKNPEGRPSQQQKVLEWQMEHPHGKKAECVRETGLSRSTVDRHWNQFKARDFGFKTYADVLEYMDSLTPEELEIWTQQNVDAIRTLYDEYKKPLDLSPEDLEVLEKKAREE